MHLFNSSIKKLCVGFSCLQNGILRRIQAKESEHESYEQEISEVDLSRIDERDRNMVMCKLCSFLYTMTLCRCGQLLSLTSCFKFCARQKLEVERKANQLAVRDFESNIRQKQSEVYTIEQKIKSLNREKDILAADSEDRVKLSLKKSELESLRKKFKKMSVMKT